MTTAKKRVEFVLGSLAIAIAFLLIVHADSVHAQAVGNGDFKVPNVSGDPGGFVQDGDPALSGHGVLWNFPTSPGGDSGITVGGSAGYTKAPNAPDGDQMAWIENLGVIWQTVTLTPGNYELSFKLAKGSFGCSLGNCVGIPAALPIRVSIGTQTFPPYTPASTTSFDTVTTPPFKVVGTEAQKLQFIGTGPAYSANQEDHFAFIDAVSIKPVLPKIISGPSDIDPTSIIVLEGEHFGLVPGQIKVGFQSQSPVPFSNANGSKTEFHLDTILGADTLSQSAFPIDIAHPQGAADSQTVDITLTVPGEQTSNVWHANFHNKAVITSVSPDSITPGRLFTLKGWDFDSRDECMSEKTGTVTVRFSDKAFPHSDLVLSIPKSGCLSDAINMMLPANTAGVVAQAVTITYKSPGGRKSNPWPVQFVPKLETKILPWQDVIATCGNESTLDICNNPNIHSVGPCLMSLVPWGQSGYSPPDEDSMIAEHWGCFGISSNDGTDTYASDIAFGRGWTITGVDAGAIANNASFSYTVTPPLSTAPVNLVFVDVNWHIGATGGEIFYNGDIYITGPAGVPFE